LTESIPHRPLPGLDNIYVLAQYNSTSLNRHLSRAYSFVNGARGWMDGQQQQQLARWQSAGIRCE
jgi:ADP-glucose pyrophosphorylase